MEGRRRAEAGPLAWELKPHTQVRTKCTRCGQSNILGRSRIRFYAEIGLDRFVIDVPDKRADSESAVG